MRAPNRTLCVVAAVAVLVAACSGGDDDAAPAATTTEPDVVTTTAPPAPGTTAPTTTAADTTGPATSAWEQIETLRNDPDTSELDLALAEFSVLFAPVPGGPAIEPDGTYPPSVGHLLDSLDALADQLTPEQQAFIDEQVDAVFGPEHVLDEFMLYDAGPVRGFRGTPVDRPTQAAIQSVANTLSSHLGGPQLKIYTVIVDGDALDGAGARNSGLAPDSDRRAEFLEDGLDVDCVIQLKEGFAIDEEFRGIIVHEIFHCWHWTRIGFDATKWARTGDWAIEGMAAYAGEVIGGTTRWEAEWWGGYSVPTRHIDLAWPLFDRTYDAIGFWSRVAEDSDVWAAMRRTIDASPPDSAMYDAALAEMGGRRSWLVAGTVNRPDWGSGWVATGPGLPAIARQTKTHALRTTQSVIIHEEPGHQRTHVIDAQPPASEDGVVMTILTSGSGVMRIDPDDLVLSGLRVTNEFCLGSCECPDGTSPFTPDRQRPGGVEITAALVGPSTGTSTYQLDMEPFDPESDRCDQPPPTTVDVGEVSGSLVGTWRASPEAVAQMFMEASAFGADSPIDIVGAGGKLLMALRDDGSGTLKYDNVTLFINDEAVGDLTLTGSGTFAWGVTDGIMTISNSDFEIGVTSSSLGDILTLTDEDVGGGGGSTKLVTQFSGANQLALLYPDGSVGTVFFPRIWTRQ